MSHFSDEAWVDRVRGIEPGAVAELEGHLDEGCDECRQGLRVWQSVREIVARDEAYEPPPAVVAAARAAFDVTRVETGKLGVVRAVELLFDSLRSPLPAGIRAVAQPARYLSYRAGEYFVDVRIEERPNSEKASVTGQFQKLKSSGSVSLEGLDVVLTQGEARLINTKTNRSGEFAFEMDRYREYLLSISVGRELAVVLPIGGAEE